MTTATLEAPPQLLTIPEAAAALRLGRNAIYRRIADGTLRAVDIAPKGAKRTRLRIPADALERYIQSLPDPTTTR